MTSGLNQQSRTEPMKPTSNHRRTALILPGPTGGQVQFQPSGRGRDSGRTVISLRRMVAVAAASSYTPALQPSPGAHSDEASSGVQLRSPVGLLLTCGLRMDRAPLGLNPELRTPRLPATHVRAETSLEH
jgi:hypothetical protein